MVDLAARVRDGVQALREGRPADAVALLTPVAEDAELQAAADLVDVRARVCSLLAQALLETNDLKPAERWAREALHLAEAEGDPEGAEVVRALHRQIFAAGTEAHRARQRRQALRAMAERSVDDLLSKVQRSEERLGVLLEKAAAELEVGRRAQGLLLARQVRDEAISAQDVRHEVLAHLTIARAEPDLAEQALNAAWRTADEVGETQLVAAVARAAELAGVTLPALVGPDIGSPA